MALKRKRTGRAGQQPTVLLVEPRAEDLERTRGLLGEAGFRVVPLSRFDAAVPLFEVIRPDAVVLAAQAPDFSAVVTARRLRQMSRGTVPLFYVVDPHDGHAYRFCLEKGQGVDVVSRDSGVAEWALKLRAQLELKEAVRRAVEEGEGGSAQALHEPITGLYNKSFLLALIGMESRRAERHGGSFSVVACSINGFRAFFKEYGRGMTERLLVYCGVVLGQAVREADVVARVGQDEFALLLPGAPAESMGTVLARIASRFEQARFQVDGKVLRLAVSLGAVSFPDTMGTPTQLLSAALQELRRMRGGPPVTGPHGPERVSV